MENWGKIEGLGRKDVEKLQNKKLNYFLKNVVTKSPYYIDLFKKNKIKLSEIKTVHDLKKIPFTTKKDIAPPNNPERFIIQDKNKPVHVHFTAGRTAAPTPFFYTDYDLNNLKEVGKRLFSIFRADKRDIAVNAFPYAPHLAFWQSYFALNAAGVMALHSGGGKILGTEKIIRSAAGMKATTILGMPGYVYHLLRTAKEEGINLNSVNKIILGGERVDKGLIEKLKGFLKNARILSTYGFTEGKCVWGQCSEDSGYHLYPDLEYIEVVDKNGENVGEGEKGEIVYSALDWRGSVVLRYKTGDLVDGIYYDKCDCGRSIRLGNKIERTSEVKEFNLVKLKGNLVNLNMFYTIINQFKEIEEWQIVIKKRNNDPYELDELYLYVSIKKADFEKLKNKINEKVKAATEITFTDIIQLKNEEMINRLGLETELKERRIVDKR